MEQIAEQLMYDANKGFINKNDLLLACLETMTENQIYKMAIKNDFIITEDDSAITNPSQIDDDTQSIQEKIIDAVLARHGD
jgi:hypothetical protein